MEGHSNTNHKIIDWFRKGGTFQNYLVPFPHHGKGHFLLDQVVQSFIQPDFEYYHLQLLWPNCSWL